MGLLFLGKAWVGAVAFVALRKWQFGAVINIGEVGEGKTQGVGEGQFLFHQVDLHYSQEWFQKYWCAKNVPKSCFKIQTTA